MLYNIKRKVLDNRIKILKIILVNIEKSRPIKNKVLIITLK